MKAKAMKKTLSCILALSLTASMMAESLTAVASFTPTSGIVESDTKNIPQTVAADITDGTTGVRIWKTEDAKEAAKADFVSGDSLYGTLEKAYTDAKTAYDTALTNYKAAVSTAATLGADIKTKQTAYNAAYDPDIVDEKLTVNDMSTLINVTLVPNIEKAKHDGDDLEADLKPNWDTDEKYLKAVAQYEAAVDILEAIVAYENALLIVNGAAENNVLQKVTAKAEPTNTTYPEVEVVNKSDSEDDKITVAEAKATLLEGALTKLNDSKTAFKACDDDFETKNKVVSTVAGLTDFAQARVTSVKVFQNDNVTYSDGMKYNSANFVAKVTYVPKAAIYAKDNADYAAYLKENEEKLAVAKAKEDFLKVTTTGGVWDANHEITTQPTAVNDLAAAATAISTTVGTKVTSANLRKYFTDGMNGDTEDIIKKALAAAQAYAEDNYSLYVTTTAYDISDAAESSVTKEAYQLKAAKTVYVVLDASEEAGDTKLIENPSGGGVLDYAYDYNKDTEGQYTYDYTGGEGTITVVGVSVPEDGKHQIIATDTVLATTEGGAVTQKYYVDVLAATTNYDIAEDATPNSRFDTLNSSTNNKFVGAYNTDTPANSTWATVTVAENAATNNINWTETTKTAIEDKNSVYEGGNVVKYLAGLTAAQINTFKNNVETADKPVALVTYDSSTDNGSIDENITILINVYDKEKVKQAASVSYKNGKKQSYGGSEIDCTLDDIVFPVVDTTAGEYATIQVMYKPDATGFYTDELPLTIQDDAVKTMALAGTADFEKAGTWPADIKQGGTFYLGDAVLKVTMNSDNIEYIFGVPQYQLGGTDTAPDVEIADVFYYALPVTRATKVAVTTAINAYLTAYDTFWTTYAVAMANETPAAQKTALLQAIDAYNTIFETVTTEKLNGATYFSLTTAYGAGDVVIYEDKWYVCPSAREAEAWDAADFVELNILNSRNIRKFSNETGYNAGDCVIYNGKLIQFTNAHNAGNITGEDEYLEIPLFAPIFSRWIVDTNRATGESATDWTATLTGNGTTTGNIFDNDDEIFIDFTDNKQNPGYVDLYYRGAKIEDQQIDITAESLGKATVTIAAIEDDTEVDGFNATRIALGSEAKAQNGAAYTDWGIPDVFYPTAETTDNEANELFKANQDIVAVGAADNAESGTVNRVIYVENGTKVDKNFFRKGDVTLKFKLGTGENAVDTGKLDLYEGLQGNTPIFKILNPDVSSGSDHYTWIGVEYTDPTSGLKATVYLPAYVEKPTYKIVIDKTAATKKVYMKGETFNPDGVKVTLTNSVTGVVKEKTALSNLTSTTGYAWYFNNGVDAKPTLPAKPKTGDDPYAKIRAALNNTDDPNYVGQNELIVYHLETDELDTEYFGEAENYVTAISVTQPETTVYDVGYYQDGIKDSFEQAELPTIEELAKTVTVTFTYADKSQKNITLALTTPDAIDVAAGENKWKQRTYTFVGDPVNNFGAGKVTISAPATVSTTGTTATIGALAYTVKYTPVEAIVGGYVDVAEDTINITTRNVTIESVEPYDGTPIPSSSYYNGSDAYDTVPEAADYVPTTTFYVGEEIFSADVEPTAAAIANGSYYNYMESGYNVGRNGKGTKNGSLLVTYSDGKKQIVNLDVNATTITEDTTSKLIIPAIDSTTADESRVVKMKYKVPAKTNRYAAYEGDVEIKLTIKNDTIEELAQADNSAVIFYKGDDTFGIFDISPNGNVNNIVHLDEDTIIDKNIFVEATYANRAADDEAFDLLDDNDLDKFSINETEFKGLVEEVSEQAEYLTLTYKADPTIKLKLRTYVLPVPFELDLTKPDQTIYLNGTTPSLAGGKIEIIKGGQHPFTEPVVVTLDDIVDGTVSNPLVDGKFKITEGTKTVTRQYINELSNGDHTLTIQYYFDPENQIDKYSVQTTLNINKQASYVTDLTLTGATAAASAFVGGTLTLDDAAGLTAKFKATDDAETEKDFLLKNLAIYDVDDDGEPDATAVKLKEATVKTGEYKNAYMTVTYVDPETKKVTSDIKYNKSTQTYTFEKAGEHTVTVYVDDVTPKTFTVNVAANEPKTIVIGSTGTAKPTYGDANGNLFVGQELVFTGGTFTVAYADGKTTKTLNIVDAIADGTLVVTKSDFKKNVAGTYAVTVTYAEAGATVKPTATISVTNKEDAVKSFVININGKPVVDAISEGESDEYITYFVGQKADELTLDQDIDVTLTYDSGSTITVDLNDTDIIDMFTIDQVYTAQEDLTVRKGKIAYGDLEAKDFWYNVSKATVGVAEKKTDLSQVIFKAGATTLALDGYTFDFDLLIDKDDKEAVYSKDGISIKDAQAAKDNWTFSLSKSATENDKTVADINSIGAGGLTAGTYYVWAAYTDKAGKYVRSNTESFLLPGAVITVKAADEYADKLAVTTAPTGFGAKKDKITIAQYGYANADAFIAALKADNSFAITAYAANDTTGFATGKKLVVGDGWAGWTFDAESIDFDTADNNYTLTVKYQNVKLEIPVEVEKRTIVDLQFVTEDTYDDEPDFDYGTAKAWTLTENTGVILGAGEDWDGRDEADKDIYIVPVYDDDTYGAAVSLATELANIKNNKNSGITIEYADSSISSVPVDTATNIKITYGGKSVQIKDVQILAADEVTGLEFKKLPKKLDYKANQEIELDEAEIEGTFQSKLAAGIYHPWTAKVDKNDLVLGAGLVTDGTVISNAGITPAVESSVSDATVKVTSFGWDKDNLITVTPAAGIVILRDTDKLKDRITYSENTPKSLDVTGATPSYYLAYKGLYSANDGDNRLKKGFTTNTVEKDEDKATSKPAFDYNTGKATVTYKELAATNVNEFTFGEDIVTGTLGDGEIKISIADKAGATVDLPNAAGTYDAKVSYTEGATTVTDTYEVEIKQDKIKKITLNKPDDVEYIYGETLNLTGAYLTFEFESGRQVDKVQLPSDNVKITGYDPLTVGTQTVTAQYIEKDAKGKDIQVEGTDKADVMTFEVTVKENEVEKIEIEQPPYNFFNYSTGYDDFNFEGALIKVTWKNEKTLEDGTTSKTELLDMDALYKATGDDKLEILDTVDFSVPVKDKTIRYKYKGQQDSFKINIVKDDIRTVTEVEGTITKKVPLKTKLEDWLKNGSIKVTFNYAKEKTITLADGYKSGKILIDGWTDGVSTELEQELTLTITYKENGMTKAMDPIKVTVSDDLGVKEIAVDDVTLNIGDTFDPSAVAVTVTKKDGTVTNTKLNDTTAVTYTIADEAGAAVTAIDTAKTGKYTVTVKSVEDTAFEGKTFNVTVTDIKVKSIEVSDVTLKDGKKFDPAAIDAKITLDDAAATTETVKLNDAKLTYTIADDATGAAVTEIDTAKAGTYTVTVKSAIDSTFAGSTFKVTVVTITDAKLTPPAKLEFKTGEAVGYGDAKMTVTYSDNTTKEFKLADGTGLTITITDAAGTEIEDITKIDTTKAGVYTVKVSVTGDNRVPASFTITIVDANKITDEDIEIPEETPTIDSRVVTFTKSGDSWTQGAGAATLTEAFRAIGNGSGDYMFVVSGNITEESALKLPSKATGITIVGEGIVTLKKPTTFNVKTANISINCPIDGTLNVTVGKEKTLKVGENVKALGTIKGDATSKIDFIGEGAVTVGSISKAAEVYAESGRVITMSGNKAKVQNVAKIKAEFALSDGAAISSSAFEEGIVTIKGEKTKVTITDATTKFLDIIIDAEDKALTSGTAVLFGNGKFDPSTNVVIRNKDSEGNKLSAVAYNKNKEVRAENIELISYTIGEDGEEQNISSFEALFDKLNSITGDVFVTLNDDAEISKAAKYPTKFTGKLSIDGNGYKINSLGLSALAPKGDLTIKNLAALTVKGVNKFAVKGAKNKTLTLEDNSAEFYQITGFTNVVADSVIVTNKFQVTNLTLSGLFVVQNMKAAVTVDNLTIVDDGAFGFVDTEKKQKTITVKKTVTKDADAKVVLIMVTKSGDVYEEDDTKSMTTGATVFTDSAKKLAATDVDATGLKAGGTGSVSVKNGKFTVA